eukprot:1311795-Amphidinium_carterae.1
MASFLPDTADSSKHQSCSSAASWLLPSSHCSQILSLHAMTLIPCRQDIVALTDQKSDGSMPIPTLFATDSHEASQNLVTCIFGNLNFLVKILNLSRPAPVNACRESDPWKPTKGKHVYGLKSLHCVCPLGPS